MQASGIETKLQSSPGVARGSGRGVSRCLVRELLSDMYMQAKHAVQPFINYKLTNVQSVRSSFSICYQLTTRNGVNLNFSCSVRLLIMCKRERNQILHENNTSLNASVNGRFVYKNANHGPRGGFTVYMQKVN